MKDKNFLTSQENILNGKRTFQRQEMSLHTRRPGKNFPQEKGQKLEQDITLFFMITFKHITNSQQISYWRNFVWYHKCHYLFVFSATHISKGKDCAIPFTELYSIDSILSQGSPLCSYI